MSQKGAKIQKQDWQENVVYLYQFPRSKYCPNVSPFCLKLEAFLRVYDIKHEVVETKTGRSNKGLLPFIELNGEQIADSQLIILELIKRFNIYDRKNVTEEQQGYIRAIDRMIEGSFHHTSYVFKLLKNSQNFAAAVLEDANPMLKFIVGNVLYRKAKTRLYGEGTARHSDEEILTLMRADLKAAEQILDDKEFLVGDHPTLADCTLFGHLASFYYLPYDMPMKQMLDEEFPKVKSHMERMARMYFKDHPIGQTD